MFTLLKIWMRDFITFHPKLSIFLLVSFFVIFLVPTVNRFLEYQEFDEIPFYPKRPTIESLRYFRDLGFFAQYRQYTDSEIIEILNNQNKKEASAPLETEIYDVNLLVYDTQRVWMEDLEADAFPDTGVYIETLKQWKAISRGVFTPQNIREVWKGDITTGYTMNLYFVLNGKQHRIRIQIDEWIELGALLDGINPLIAHSGYQFYAPDLNTGQAAFVVLLTQKEQLKLVQDRGWKF